MIIARAAIMVAIEEYDENVCYLLLASFPWGKTASIRQVNENRMIPRSANAGISKRCCYAIGVSHWKQPCSVGVPRPKDAPEPWLCPSTTNDFPLKNPLQRFAASVCMFMVIHGYTSSWCWQLLIHVIWEQHESQATFSDATWFRFVATPFVSETMKGRQGRRQVGDQW